MRSYFLFLLSWFLVAFGQPAWIPFCAPLAACFGFAIFWKSIEKKVFLSHRFYLAAFWFSAVQLVQLSWMTQIEVQGSYLIPIYLAISLLIGSFFGIITLLIEKIPLVATASLWTLVEWIRFHFFFSGFSWNPIGLSLTALSSSLQAASLFGILGLSFLVFLTNLAIWKKVWPLGAILALFPYLFGWIQIEIREAAFRKGETLKIGLVQTGWTLSQKNLFFDKPENYISPCQQWAHIISLIKKEQKKLDLIVLPETAIPCPEGYTNYSIPDTRSILNPLVGSTAIPEKVTNRFWIETLSNFFQADIIAGSIAEEDGCSFNSALFYPFSSNRSVERYDKQILVPLGEYLPFRWVEDLARKAGVTAFFVPGKKSKKFSTLPAVAPSICYEDTFPHLIRKGVIKGASILVNISNDNWFIGSRLSRQHADHARVRAVENGVPMVRASNTGVTAAIDSFGRIISQITDEQTAKMLTVDLPLYSYPTLYRLLGDHSLLFLSLTLLILSLASPKRREPFLRRSGSKPIGPEKIQ